MKKMAAIILSCLCFASLGQSAFAKAPEKTKVVKKAKVVDKQTNKKSVATKKSATKNNKKIVQSNKRVVANNFKVASQKNKNIGKARQRSRQVVQNNSSNISRDLKYVIFEYGSGEILEAKNADKVWPVASLTKLMTAHVFLRNHKDIGNCTQQITSADNDTIKFTRSRLKKDVDYKCEDLLEAMLTVSDNYAASALARAIPGWSKNDFVKEMNMQAKRWGLDNTRFVDSSGLSPLNVSSARDYAKLTMKVGHTPFLSDLATISGSTVSTVHGHETQINNTNPMVRNGFKSFISKTGYIKESGYNLAFVSDSCDKQIGFVELGARSKGERNNFARTALSKYECK